MSYRFSHKDFGLRSQIKIRPQRTILMDFVVSYRFSHQDFGLRSQIKIRPQRTIVRLRIILIWRPAKIFMTKSVIQWRQLEKPKLDDNTSIFFRFSF